MALWLHAVLWPCGGPHILSSAPVSYCAGPKLSPVSPKPCKDDTCQRRALQHRGPSGPYFFFFLLLLFLLFLFVCCLFFETGTHCVSICWPRTLPSCARMEGICHHALAGQFFHCKLSLSVCLLFVALAQVMPALERPSHSLPPP